eukprot:526747-Rhodomonas_salina.1
MGWGDEFTPTTSPSSSTSSCTGLWNSHGPARMVMVNLPASSPFTTNDQWAQCVQSYADTQKEIAKQYGDTQKEIAKQYGHTQVKYTDMQKEIAKQYGDTQAKYTAMQELIAKQYEDTQKEIASVNKTVGCVIAVTGLLAQGGAGTAGAGARMNT